LHDLPTIATLLLLILPWWSLLVLRDNFQWLDLFGETVGIAFVFWWMSRSGAMAPPAIKRPRLEFLFAMILIFVWVAWRIGICTNAFPFLPAKFNCFKSFEFEIAPKVFEQVILPFAVLFLMGYGFRAQGLNWSWRAWWISLPALLAVTGYGIYLHYQDLPKFATNNVEYFFAAGLPEEFLFRSILLTRLEAWWKSPAWAVFGSSAIFGLTHLPIDYLVFTRNDMREAWITLLTFQMGLGAVFAFAYQRTRNVLPLALLHTIIDAI
jgi:membrane protease YdiL (CAAX protease family)